MLLLQTVYKNLFFLFVLVSTPFCAFCDDYSTTLNHENFNFSQSSVSESNSASQGPTEKCRKHKKLSYYLYIEDFIKSFIEIPTSNVLIDSTTISSRYLAGRAPLYNRANKKVGTCSASFLCMQTQQGIFTDISNYLSIDRNGLIVTWFTPTTLINLELDTILHSMVTECIVLASTKVGFNLFYGKKFNMVVSSDDNRIYFKLTQID